MQISKKFVATMKQLPHMISYLEENFSLSTQQRVGIEELLVNIMEHGYGKREGEIAICYKKEAVTSTIQIIDGAKAFNPLLYQPSQKSLSLESSSLRGRGILLAKTIFPSMIYERVDGKNILQLHCS